MKKIVIITLVLMGLLLVYTKVFADNSGSFQVYLDVPTEKIRHIYLDNKQVFSICPAGEIYWDNELVFNATSGVYYVAGIDWTSDGIGTFWLWDTQRREVVFSDVKENFGSKFLDLAYKTYFFQNEKLLDNTRFITDLKGNQIISNIGFATYGYNYFWNLDNKKIASWSNGDFYWNDKLRMSFATSNNFIWEIETRNYDNKARLRIFNREKTEILLDWTKWEDFGSGFSKFEWNLDYNGTLPLVKIVSDWKERNIIIPMDLNFASSSVAYIPRIFNDLSKVIILIIGLPLGFWGTGKVIALIRGGFKTRM